MAQAARNRAGLVHAAASWGMIPPVPGLQVVVDDDPTARAAAEIAARLRDAVAARGDASLAVSGGSTGRGLLIALAATDVAWSAVRVWQVDERVAPDGDPDRNAGQLDVLPGEHLLMPVTAPDLEQAAADYGAGLPDVFDVVHLGIGPDGHTASWPPGDPVIDRTTPVALSAPYRGRVRMTLTPPVVDAARARVVLVAGADKAAAVAGWLDGTDPMLPIARVTPVDTVVVLDPAAAADLAAAGVLPGSPGRA
jgi:6-phosphogluconolactonase/glucosamine-6-phosphate isomerase/deaminase